MSSVAWEKRYCRDCAWRDDNGKCRCDKLREREWWDASGFDEKPENSDCLIYSYDEGGSFWVGPDFGCVHWRRRGGKTGGES